MQRPNQLEWVFWGGIINQNGFLGGGGVYCLDYGWYWQNNWPLYYPPRKP